MRCRVGDLAVVVIAAPPHEDFVGRIVRCVAPRTDKPHSAWFIEPKLGVAVSIADECLRPIRDPGDDAEDEMLSIARLKDQEKAIAMRHAMQKHRERVGEKS